MKKKLSGTETITIVDSKSKAAFIAAVEASPAFRTAVRGTADERWVQGQLARRNKYFTHLAILNGIDPDQGTEIIRAMLAKPTAITVRPANVITIVDGRP
jgi:hypothetical protein